MSERVKWIERKFHFDFPVELYPEMIHPRLKVEMRLVDMIFFQAEHDDFHLARISELIKLFELPS